MYSVLGVKVVQLEECELSFMLLGRSSSSCAKLTKSLQQAFNPKTSGSFNSSLKLGNSEPRYNVLGTR